MSAVMPYIGLEEISSDKVGTAKALVAELLGTLILVNIIVWSTYLLPCYKLLGNTDDQIVTSFMIDSK